MVATDDGAGGDDKMEDSCNGNEATTAAALVSQMGAGETMQVDGDGNFVLPQVDGPIDFLLSEDEEKTDIDEEPAENTTESTADGSTNLEQDNNIAENIHTEESTVKEGTAASETATDLPESITATDEASEEAEGIVNPLVDDRTPMDVSADSAELTSEKTEDLDNPLVEEACKAVKSPVEAESEASLADVADPMTEINETQEDKSNQTKNIKVESHLENVKSPVLQDLPIDNTGASHLTQDEILEEKNKNEIAESKTSLLPESSSLVKPESMEESMNTHDSTLTPEDSMNTTPVTTSIAMPLKSEPIEEPVRQAKLPDLPTSSVNGVATLLEKETENLQKIFAPVKMEAKDELGSKRENLKQEKVNDTRSETGDDSTALTTLATAALGSAEPVKVKNEQVNFFY